MSGPPALSRFIRDVPDFPRPGIVYRDISPLLADPVAYACAVDLMAAPFAEAQVDHVVGIEARGFMFGAAVAHQLHVGFVPARKPGKLPAETHAVTYDLEYGEDSLEIHTDALAPGSSVLLVDDVLATGGTLAAAAALVRKADASVAGASVLIELEPLGGRAKLEDVEVYAVMGIS